MNNWNFNELTQQDILDFKACKHNQTGEIYGIKETSTCQSGKEVSKEDFEKLVRKSNEGDPKAKAQIKQYQASMKKVEDTAAKERKAKAEAEKKKKEEEGKKGKKGKKGGGKGKKGGGKGKGGKGGKGKGGKGGKGKGDKGGSGGSANTSTSRRISSKEAAQRMQKNRKERQQAMRKRLGDLQKSLRSVENPEVRKALESQISDLLKGVNELSKMDPASSGDKAPTSPGKNPASSGDKAPTSPGKEPAQKPTMNANPFG